MSANRNAKHICKLPGKKLTSSRNDIKGKWKITNAMKELQMAPNFAILRNS
jgi:hypothetical protein